MVFCPHCGVPLSPGRNSFEVVQGRATSLDFKTYGLPPTAEILYLNFTAVGELTPLLLHGNDVWRASIGTDCAVVATGPWNDQVVAAAELSVLAVWSRHWTTLR